MDMDFATARRMMVDSQVRTSDVTNLDLIAAMAEIPREKFVPASQAEVAYLDRDIAVSGAGDRRSARWLLKPMVLARLIQSADIDASDKVLDVGCASGYSSAVLARLAGSVVALEASAELAGKAEEALREVGAQHVSVMTGALIEGWPDDGPYDVILLNGLSEILPEALCRQLNEGGRLVGVFSDGSAPKAMVYLAERGEVSGRAIFDAAAPLLPGFVKPPAFVF
jgi:protein-L-isoaspartate(D-aspartate) O-methyltransferase